MYIKELVIYGYGKWENKRIPLTNGFVAFLGQNEMGKSTVQSFIQSMLFGLPKMTRKKDVNLYVPKESSNYGGKIVLDQTPYGEVTIERLRKGKTSVENTITTSTNRILTQEDINALVHGISLEVYQQFFSIALDQLQALKDIKKEDLNRYFLTIGLSGSETLFEWHDKWLAESNKLYRPSATKLPLNTLLEAYKEQAELVDKLALQQQSYADLTIKLETITKDITTLQQKEAELVEQINRQKLVQQLQPSFVKYEQLKNQLPTTPQVNQQAIEQFQAFQIEKQALIEQLAKANERLEQVDYPDELRWFRENEQRFKYGVMTLPKVEQLLKTIGTADYQMEIQKEAFDSELSRLNLQATELPAERITLDEEGIALINERKALQETQQNLEKTHQLAKSNVEDSQQKEQQLTQDYQNTNLTSRTQVQSKSSLLWVGGLGVGAILSIAGGLLQQWLVLGVGVIAVVLSAVMMLLQQQQKQTQQRIQQELQEDRKQRYLASLMRQQEHTQLYQSQLEECQRHLLNNQTALNDLNQQTASYKKMHAIPETLTLETIQEGALDYVQSLNEKYYQLDATKQQALVSLNQMDEDFAFFNAQVTSNQLEDTLAFRRERIVQFKQFVDKWQVEDIKWQEKTRHLQWQEKDIVLLKDKQQQLYLREQALFKENNVTDELSFKQLMQEKSVYEQKQKEKELLYAQIEPYKNELATFDSNQLNALNEQWQTMQEQSKQLLAQQANIKQSMQFLEKDGQFAQQQQKLALLEEQVVEQLQTVGAYHNAVGLIEALLQHGKTQNVDGIIAHASDYFARLTQNRYQHIMFTDDMMSVKRHDGVMFELHELSMGTLDQLYIALRLAFIQSLDNRVDLPLIIDDCFVNFDDTRKQAMLSILEEIATHRQVIYLTYDSAITQTNAQVVALANL